MSELEPLTKMHGVLVACGKCGSLTFIQGGLNPIPYNLKCPECGFSAKTLQTDKIWYWVNNPRRIRLQYLTILVSRKAK